MFLENLKWRWPNLEEQWESDTHRQSSIIQGRARVNLRHIRKARSMNAARLCAPWMSWKLRANSQDANVNDGTMDPSRKRNWLHKRKRIRLQSHNVCTGVRRGWFIAANGYRGNKEAVNLFAAEGRRKTEQVLPRLRFKGRRKPALRREPLAPSSSFHGTNGAYTYTQSGPDEPVTIFSTRIL